MLNKSIYSHQIKTIIDIFPRENILFLSFEKLFGQTPQIEHDRLTDVLGISSMKASPLENVVNSSRQTTKTVTRLEKSLNKICKLYFKQDVASCNQLIPDIVNQWKYIY